MDYKGYSKPMEEILTRLDAFPEIQVIMFGEENILNKEVEDWPHCDCLIAFHSLGFPLEKAMRYIQLNPTVYCINELSWQTTLLDRRAILRILQRNSIPCVKHVIMSRDGSEEEPTFIETKDYIEVNGKRMTKPFVEKPVDADDHNITIYFHSAQGGGSVRLFRKISNKSSERSDNSSVRKNGSYIYEEFIDTQNSHDIKVYTIGPEYAHSEARKAPFVDGIVIRGEDGKELRQICNLTPEEQVIAKKVSRAFKQPVCGFDLLRDKTGKAFVCDVNGWSFVKNSPKYYDDFASIMRNMFIQARISQGLPQIKTVSGVRILRGVSAVFRHADRTPKQKVKVNLNAPEILNMFADSTKEIKLKNDSENDIERMKFLVEVSKEVIKRKEGLVEVTDSHKLLLFNTVIQKKFGGTKVQLKPKLTTDESGKKKVTQVLLICKWGGILTHAGIQQSEILGRYFAERVFPKENAQDFLSSLEVFSNTERRVKATAEAFASGVLGGAAPANIFREDKLAVKLLGDIAAGKDLMENTKRTIFEVMHLEDASKFNHLPGVDELNNPLQCMRDLHALIKELYNELPSQATPCEGETVPMMQQRWHRLTTTFWLAKKGHFDTTKIPDIFDYINYDILHNHAWLNHIDLSGLYEKAELLSKFIVPAEYGTTPQEKLTIGSLICEDLVQKFYTDMVEMSKGEGAKTRLYFTSESHLHSMRNVLLHSGSSKFHELIEPVELSYLSNLVFKIYENLGATREEERFQIEVLFCSGCHNNPFGVMNSEHRQAVRAMVSVNDDLGLEELKEIVKKVDHVVEENQNK